MFAKILIQEGKSGHRLSGFVQRGDPEVCYQRIVPSEECSYMNSLGLGRMDGKKEMEYKRKDADASPRQLHLGGSL
jgi:hypothetical protein